MYKDEYDALCLDYDTESKPFRDAIMHNLIYLATFGLEDPLRDGVNQTVQLIRYGMHVEDASALAGVREQVKVRLVSGDHPECAKRTAVHSGIITDAQTSEEGVCYTGAEFEAACGGYS